ncbi:MAG: HAD family hydrolase [Pseudomonadota bacterium]|nr:HAD family hydrolase [Pseudomonadota bacterium]
MTEKNSPRLLTIDLDDTLWPCAPTIHRAEARLYSWLERTAPRLTEAHDPDSLRRQRRDLMQVRPEIAHDLTAVRRDSLRELLAAFGYEEDLADDAMALFLDHRNRVEPYSDVIPALRGLAVQYRLVSITNGNSDVTRTPLRGLFHHSLTAAGVGAARPDPALFLGALEWARIPSDQALHVGDDPRLDVEAARRVGMATVWVNRDGNSWPQELAPPDAEVADLIELDRWLKGCAHAL